jgi:hypothetical protein
VRKVFFVALYMCEVVVHVCRYAIAMKASVMMGKLVKDIGGESAGRKIFPVSSVAISVLNSALIKAPALPLVKAD